MTIIRMEEGVILAVTGDHIPALLRRAAMGLRAFKATVFLAALLLALFVLLNYQGLTLPFRELTIPAAWQLALFLALAVLAENVTLRMPDYGGIPVANAVYFSLVILYGPAPTLLVLLAAGVTRVVYAMRGSERESPAFSLAQTFLAFGAGSIAFYFLAAAGDFFSTPPATAQNLIALALAATLCFSVETLFTALAKSLETGASLYPRMIDFRRLKVYLLMLAPLGLLISTLFQIGPWSLLFLVPPMAVVIKSIKSYTDVLVEAKYTIESLSLAVENRDPYTINHSERVARYCEDMARHLQLPEEQVENVISAAKLHDMGKISVAQEILGKVEALTEDEMYEIQRHPTVGGEVAGHLSLCRDAAVIISQHHERHDGKGYPSGLRGFQIHRGARILAVAEAFDSMTTPRAYKDALTVDEALEILKKERGGQFDPFVVDAFIEVWARKGSAREVPETEIAVETP